LKSAFYLVVPLEARKALTLGVHLRVGLNLRADTYTVAKRQFY